MSCCGICGIWVSLVAPPVASSATIMSPSHFHPATIGWSVLNHLLLLHPHIPAAFSHLTGIVPSSTVFWFHFSKTKAYCCPVSRSVCSHFQAGGKVVRQYRNCKKSGPRNSRDDSLLLALLSWWHVFPPSAVISDFLADIIKFSL